MAVEDGSECHMNDNSALDRDVIFDTKGGPNRGDEGEIISSLIKPTAKPVSFKVHFDFLWVQ